MNTETPAPGWPASMRAARVRDLEAAVAAATGKPSSPLKNAERLPLRTLAQLIEAFTAAEALAADPLEAIAARVARADAFLNRVGEDQEPGTAELVACLRKLKDDLIVLTMALDAVLRAHGGES